MQHQCTYLAVNNALSIFSDININSLPIIVLNAYKQLLCSNYAITISWPKHSN